jgi:hypothetical protein
MAEREEEPEGIAGVIRCEKTFFRAPIWHSEPEKKGRLRSIGGKSRELPRETRLGPGRISTKR